MRTAQIGGDGVLRDSSGFVHGRGEGAPSSMKRTPSSMKKAPVRNNGMFGLGATPTTDPRLHQIVEGQFNLGAPRPVSTYTYVHAITTSKPDKELIAGRFVFPRSGVDTTVAARVNVDPAGVYMISARPSEPGNIALMKIEGDSARWVETSMAFFTENFLVASIPATFVINSTYPIFAPIFDGKDDVLKLSPDYIRTLAISAYDLVIDAVNAPVDLVSNRAKQREFSKDLAIRALTALGFLDVAIRFAGSGFDTNYIGFKGYYVLAETLAPMIKSTARVFLKARAAYISNAPQAYVEASAALVDYTNKGAIWGEGLKRSSLWSSLTATALRSMDFVSDQAADVFSKMLSGYDADAANINKKAGITAEQGETAVRPLRDYVNNNDYSKATSKIATDSVLVPTGLTSNELPFANAFLKNELKANEQVIKSLSAAHLYVSTDADVYRTLGNLGAGGLKAPPPRTTPLEMKDTFEYVKIKLELEKHPEFIEKGLDKDSRLEVAREAWKAASPFLNRLEVTLKESESYIAQVFPPDALTTDVAMEEYIVSVQKMAKLPGADENIQSLNRAVEAVSSRGIVSKYKAIKAARARLSNLEQKSEAEPFKAVAVIIDLYSDIGNLMILPEAQTKILKIEILGDMYAEFNRSGMMPTVMTAQQFRSELVAQYGKTFAEAEHDYFLHADKQIKNLNNQIKTKEIIEGGRVIDLSGDPQKIAELQKTVERLETFTRTVKQLGSFDPQEAARALDQWNLNIQAIETIKLKHPQTYNDQLVAASKTSAKIAHLKARTAQYVNPTTKGYQPNSGLEELEKYVPYSKLPETLATILTLKTKSAIQNDKARYEVIRAGLQNQKAILDGARDALSILTKDAKTGQEWVEITRNPEAYANAIANLEVALSDFEKIVAMASNKKAVTSLYEAWWKVGIATVRFPFVFMELNSWAKKKYNLENKLIAGTAWSLTFGLVATIATAVLMIGLSAVLLNLVAFIPGMSGARALLRTINKHLGGILGYEVTRGGKGNGEAYGGEGAPGDPEQYGMWKILGIGAVGALIIAPHKVVPAVFRLVSTVIGGVSSIVGRGKGRGRPAGGKKAIGAGAPPDINRAIDDIKKGQAQGNPFLVRKGIEKLKRAKQMGLPVPKGYIDGLLGWKR